MKVTPIRWAALAAVLGTACMDAASQAEPANPFFKRAIAVCDQWYKPINDVLYGPDHPLPFENIVISMEPLKVPAYANGNHIHIHNQQDNRVDGFEGMVGHELAHVVQNYPKVPKNGLWVSEGIADYIRHKYVEKDIVPKLNVDAHGVLRGYKQNEPFNFYLQESRKNLLRKGYLLQYTIASPFLYWIEVKKDKDIVRKLNLALKEGRYSPALFRRHCGASLDALWREFITQSN